MAFINVGVVFSKKNYENTVAIGMCIRDARGNFIGVKTYCFSPIMEVREGEALSLVKNVVCLDAKLVVNYFNNPCVPILSFVVLFKDVIPYSFLSQNFYVKFTERNANKE